MKKIIELIKYGIFGVVTTAINLILFAIFKELGMYYIWANTISYFIAVIINYVFNQKYVFVDSQDKTKIEMWLQFIKFMSLRVGSLIIDNALFFMLVSVLNFGVYISRIGLSVVIILATYVVNKFFVFNKK